MTAGLVVDVQYVRGNHPNLARALKRKLCLPDRNHVARCRTHTSHQRSSWVLHTRKHIFAKVKLRSEGDLESWMKTFPDPSNSDPVYYTHTLVFRSTTTDPWAGGLIRTFSRAVRLSWQSQRVSKSWTLSPRSTNSHIPSSLSVCIFSFCHARKFSTLFVHSPFSKIYVEWRFGFMPVRMSTGYRLLASRCRRRFLATR